MDWNPGRFDRKTGAWHKEQSYNVKWVANLGSQTYGNPVVANGRIYVGTNNYTGYLKRYPANVDLGVLLCFNEADGSFLWQHSSEKLPTGRVHDWPLQGICSAPLVEGDRLWFVTSRGEVRCLDTHGFHDGEDDGRPESLEPARLFEILQSDDPADDKLSSYVAELEAGKLPSDLRANFEAAGMTLPPGDIIVQADSATQAPRKQWTFEAKVRGDMRHFHLALAGLRLTGYKIVTPADKEEADVVWTLDMMRELGVSQHNMCTCAPTAWGDTLFICTSNGVDETHQNIPAPQAPSFLALDKHTGKILWTDNSPGANIQHGQWSAPAVAMLGGVPQVIFGGGDGWVYSFHATQWQDGKPLLLWKFDVNPKDALLHLGGRGTRNEPFAMPVVYDGLVYITTGQDPEHGEGTGSLWCIDPTRRGDVSPQLAVHVSDRTKPIPHKRTQAVVEQNGELALDNPNSAVIWHYREHDSNGNGAIEFEEQFHRTIASIVAQNDVLFAVDFSGLAHCLNAKTGQLYWTYDTLAACWATPLAIGDRVYVGDEDGDLSILRLHPTPHQIVRNTPVGGPAFFHPDPLREIYHHNSFNTAPILANGVLYLATTSHLLAIHDPVAAQPDDVPKTVGIAR
jgi:outer membrane protein assembly factor BamB